MQSFEHTGFWWDPAAPECRWPGTLRFDHVDGAVLTRTISYDPRHFFGWHQAREFDILLGQAATGSLISLLRCFERDHSEVYANAVIVGLHVTSPDPAMKVAAAVFEGLEDWWGQRALSDEPGLTYPNANFSYRQPDAVEVHGDGTIRTSLRSAGLVSAAPWRVSIDEEIRFEFSASEAQPLSVFQRRAQACQDLLSIATLSYRGVKDLRMSPAAGGSGVGIGHFHAVPVFADPAENRPHGLFGYSDIASRERDVFGAWLAIAERLSVVRGLYMSGVYGKNFLELKLLALTQAVEAYHRRVYEGQDVYLEPADYEQLAAKPMKEAIPETLPDSLRQSLRSRLTFGNEHSFRKRVGSLVEEYEEALAALAPSPKEWVGRIVENRNNLTHHPLLDEEQSAPAQRALLQCNYVLRTLLEFCFLKSMAMSGAEIVELANRCRRYQQIRERFFGSS